jgi:hypothetical protein
VASQQQIALFVNDYERACMDRDIAAYRALGSIASAIVFCKQDRPKDAIAVLTEAVERYDRADATVRTLQKKGCRHDNEPTYRPAA